MADQAHPRPALTITVQVTVAESAANAAPMLLREVEEFATRINNITVAPALGSAEPDSQGPLLDVVPDSRCVRLDGAPIHLTRREFDLLLYLCRDPRRVVNREELLAGVWGYSWLGGTRTIDVHIRRLRSKLGPGVISTVHGVGYRVDERVQVTVGPHSPRAARRSPG